MVRTLLEDATTTFEQGVQQALDEQITGISFLGISTGDWSGLESRYRLQFNAIMQFLGSI